MSGHGRIDCVEALQRLNDYLDRELDPSLMTEMATHLRACGGCSRGHDYERRLLAEIRVKLSRVELPDGLMERISVQLTRAEHRIGG